MRTVCSFLTIALMAGLSLTAFGDLQNVQVGGSIRIRGNWYSGSSGPDKFTALRYPATPGRQAVTSPFFGWNDKANTGASVEQRTLLNVKADFTDNVSAFIEFDCYDVWGEDFRSNYLTGVDARPGTINDISLYQGYIEAKEMFGTPLSVRVGRQELKFGSGWLVAPNLTSALFYGTSFDAIRATYKTDRFSVDAFGAKLAERSPIEEDGDVDFYGVYGSYLGIENVTLDAYWLYLRDAQKQADTNSDPIGEWIERRAGVDRYGPTNLHTLGLRGNGKFGALDFEAEAAYQFGNADSVRATFAGDGLGSLYGPKHANFDNVGANLEVGYTFDAPWTPRIFLGGAYLGGQDNRSVNFGQWVNALVNPFWQPKASVSFNRLFSTWEYSEFMENTDFSNGWVARGGVSVNPTEKLKLSLTGMHCASLAAYHRSWLPPFSFLTTPDATDMGWEAEIIGIYSYSKDLAFEAGYAHLFVDKGLRQGDFSNGNGLIFNGGTAQDDADYLYFETRLSF